MFQELLYVLRINQLTKQTKMPALEKLALGGGEWGGWIDNTNKLNKEIK